MREDVWRLKALSVVEAIMSERSGKTRRPLSRVSAKAAQGVTGFLDGIDRRGVVARRFRDLVHEVTTDLGGPAELSEAQRQIIRRIASMSVWCESQEAKMADGENIDIDRFQRTSNSLRRLCEAIGLERKSRDITPSIHELIEARRAATTAANGSEGE
jgi:hypothetical protein